MELAKKLMNICIVGGMCESKHVMHFSLKRVYDAQIPGKPSKSCKCIVYKKHW